MTKLSNSYQSNAKIARATWGGLSRNALLSLRALTEECGLSVSAGDLLLLDGRWYVTHAGLLRIAQRNRCSSISTTLEEKLSDAVSNRWVFKATVYKSPRSRGFVGYGDADPSNTSPLVRGAEMRVAETRAVNRALRKAYGIGLCSVEELGHLYSAGDPTPRIGAAPAPANRDGSGNGHSRLRDRLCLLIRQHQLDATLVKRYAADFCGTEQLRDAGRDLVESFITTLADEATKDREALICKLNSYGHAEAVKS